MQHGIAVLMICTLTRDDMPSLSAWIKKDKSNDLSFLAEQERFEAAKPPSFYKKSIP